MRAVVAGMLVFAVTVLGTGGLSLAQTSDASRRYVVVFRGGVPSGAYRLVETAGGTLTRVLPEVGIAIARSNQLSFPSRLARSAAVGAVGEERGRLLPARGTFDFESHEVGPTPVDDLFTARQWHIRRVRADAAWPITTGSSDIVVAVIDNGVASNHPDLAPNLQFSACYSSGPACSIYPEIPFSAGGFHGTMVAGVIAAAFGHGRVVGVGPNLGLASYNVFEFDPEEEDFVAFEDSIWAAMLDATARGVRVINLSLGNLIVFPANEAAMWTAWNRVAQYVTRQGVTIVASAGNEGISVNGPVAHLPSDLPSVIGVGATVIRPNPEYPQAGALDLKPFYSNSGAALTLAAPGGDCGPTNPECAGMIPNAQTFFWIQSSAVMPNPTCAATATCLVGYTRLFGTSLAAPHVAAVAGLILSLNPGLNPRHVAAILKRTAQPLGDRQQFGHGMVDAAAAVGAP